ncbi:Protein AEXR-1, partial [Aphelenchoides avenae]
MNDSSEVINCDLPGGFLTIQAVADYALLPAVIVASFFLVAAIACAVQLLRRTADTMHVFVVNMTVADLLLAAVAHPYTILVNRQIIASTTLPCAVTQYIKIVVPAVSALSLTLINVDKFIYFRWPLKYLSLSVRRAIYVSLIAWAACLTYVGLEWIFGVVFIPDIASCLFVGSREKRYVNQMFVIVFDVAPLLSSALLSIYLFRLTRLRRRNIGNAADALGKSETVKSKLESMLFIFAATAWMTLTLLPRTMFDIFQWIAVTTGYMSCDTLNTVLMVGVVFVRLASFNP